ncbi:MAG: RNA methyltransferase [Rhodospirillales bacterium]|nr:RNA methyltransferase [Rhodospirillales bacterium]
MRHPPRRPPPRTQHRPNRPEGHASDLSKVAGLAAVSALFAQAPERVERLFFTPERRRDAEPYCKIMAEARKTYRQVPPEELARIGGSVLTGGILALARPRPVADLDPVAAALWAHEIPLLLILDGVGNPHNLGAIARTAAFFGLDRLVLSDHPAQAGPSDAAHRVAEGGLEFLSLWRAHKLPLVLKRIRPNFRVVATAPDQGKTIDQIPRDKPIALVLGNEEDGLSAPTRAACDDRLVLPGTGKIQSLNVAATAAILIHALHTPTRR